MGSICLSHGSSKITLKDRAFLHPFLGLQRLLIPVNRGSSELYPLLSPFKLSVFLVPILSFVIPAFFSQVINMSVIIEGVVGSSFFVYMLVACKEDVSLI